MTADRTRFSRDEDVMKRDAMQWFGHAANQILALQLHSFSIKFAECSFNRALK